MTLERPFTRKPALNQTCLSEGKLRAKVEQPVTLDDWALIVDDEFWEHPACMSPIITKHVLDDRTTAKKASPPIETVSRWINRTAGDNASIKNEFSPFVLKVDTLR